ncbi:MAG: ABC transporter ATP-binding protein [Peptostreptococcaceae bacterium]|nr:ABC transporter ATP-binding protein [Peptostreptococcaceae bacterium]
METKNILQVENLKVDIGKPIIKGVRFEVAGSEKLGIFGQSGSGKSLTMYAVMDLLPEHAAVEGKILLDGKNLLELSPTKRRKFLGKSVSMIFQDSINALNPYEKISRQILRTIKLHHGLSKQAAREFAEQQLLEMGLEPKRVLASYPHELSGGMRQRVFIALSLCARPKLIIADEPTTSLDTISQMRFIELMGEISEKRHLPLIFISHNLGLIAGLCDRVLVMSEGEIIEKGRVEDIFSCPKHPVTAEIVSETRKLYEEDLHE